MRILFLSSVYPKPHAPTRGVYCRHLCQALATRHEVRVLSPTPWVERLARPAPDGHRPGPDEEHPWFYYPPKVLRDRYDRFMWASVRGAVRRTVAEFRPDCVLSYWAHPDGAVAVRAGRLAGAPVAIVVGGSDVLLLARDGGRRRAIAAALTAADSVFAVSRDIQQKVVGLGVEPDRVHLFQRGIDRERFCPGDRAAARARLGLPADRNLLLWAGWMVPVKALEVLTEACAVLAGQAVDFQLLLVGEGPLRGQLEAEVARRGLGSRVRFVGRVAHDALPDWFRAADLTVLSSHSEGVPNVLRESLACGTPYVSTDVGGVAELTDDPAVRLVPPGDPAALAGAIRDRLAHRLAPDPARTPMRDLCEAADGLMRTFGAVARGRHPAAPRVPAGCAGPAL